ncbi:MAG: Gfo/Idh/MocA family oxidoreductase, partial [Calditrichota bacterium]
PLMDTAPDGPELRAGLVGCGGRGTGAAHNFLDAGPNLRIVALADLFQDRIDGTRQKLKENKNVDIPDENIYLGFDAYKRLIDSDVDIVILATPPYFRPMMFEYAVNAKKHIFMEKPVAVDPVGARSIMATARKAETLGIQVSTGTQRRHKRDYVETFRRVSDGAIGDITGGNVYWNGGQLWYREPRPEWTEMEYMIRDWVNWTWLSGDHIVEQHVHNLDVFYWFTGMTPVSALGFGISIACAGKLMAVPGRWRKLFGAVKVMPRWITVAYKKFMIITVIWCGSMNILRNRKRVLAGR